MSTASRLPNVGEALAPTLAATAPAERPLLIALAERMAAQRYRGWADRCGRPELEAPLRACAEREEEIARCVEALFDDAGSTQARLRGEHPGLEDLNRSLFEGRPLAEQYAIQARGERLGAATWRSLARDAAPAARASYLRCAALEEQSAELLESLLAGASDG